jgi:uncharacterized protein with PQ loop repeat
MSRYHRHLRIKKERALIVQKLKKPRLVDRLTFIAAVLEPVVTVPQVTVIFADRTAAGISLPTWFGYDLLTLVWLWYGWVHKDRLIILYQGLFFIVQTGVIVGGMLYGAKW